MKGATNNMQILNYFMSKKSRKFHIQLTGNSLIECIKFFELLCKIPEIRNNTVTTKFLLKDGTVEGLIICKSSNHRKFKIKLENLISQYEEEA